MDMGGVDLLTVRDGKIVEVHLFSEVAAAEDRVLGPAVLQPTRGPPSFQ